MKRTKTTAASSSARSTPARRGRSSHLPEPPAQSRAGEPWSKEEDRILRRNYKRNGAKYTAALLGRTIAGVNRRAENLGIPGARTRQWTELEDRLLRRKYPTHTALQIARTLRRTELSVRARVHALGIGESGSPKWMAIEIEYLRENYGQIPIAGIALELGRSEDSVQIKAGRLGLTRSTTPFKPTPGQMNFIVSNLGTVPYSVMARKFKVSTQTIEQIARKHGYRDRPKSRPWTEEDCRLLRTLFGTMTREQVAAKLDRTVIAVTDRARKLGLTRKVPSSGPQRRWIPRELGLVRRHYGTLTYTEIGRLIDRSPHAVSARAALLGLVTPRGERGGGKNVDPGSIED